MLMIGSLDPSNSDRSFQIFRVNEVEMKNRAFIGEVEVESDCQFIIYGPTHGKLAETARQAEADEHLARLMAEARERNSMLDCAVFRWVGDSWRAAKSLYDMQEEECQQNPSARVQLM